jgi:TatD family-associated radical SAM protein
MGLEVADRPIPGETRSEVRTEAGDVIAYTLHGNCYINLTSRCTLRCQFCPKFNKDREVVFCGLGEPTLRLPELLRVAEALKQAGARVRLNTDGLANWVYQRNIVPELIGRVDALSISLNAQDEATYNRHCRPPATGAYPELLEFILRAREAIADITLTAIDGLEGVDIKACEALAERFKVKFRRRVLDEVG